MSEIISDLDHLGKSIAAGSVGSSMPWGGASVVVCKVAPPPSKDGFYPDPRYVETNYVGEISWMFQQVRDIFQRHDGYGIWKEELFGRLGNVIQAQTSRNREVTLEHLLAASLHEAYSMAEEVLDFGGLRAMMVTWDNHIFDDFHNVSGDSAMLSANESEEFLRSLVTG